MNCPSEDRLQAFVDGHLSPAEINLISPHLDECPSCRAVIVGALPVREGAKGDLLGRYLLRRPIGSGGMGVVYEAFDPELNRSVALKLLHAELGGAQSLQARLIQEAQSLAKLSHPHVVSVYDIGRADDRVFIVMDLVDGDSVRGWLRTAHTLDEILDVFAQAAEGLVAAHSVDLVHRDFKPENVLIARDGRVMVSDFGLAFSGTQRPEAISEGSPRYMAPEQQSGAQVDARSDQFSFCVSLGEALGPARSPRWLMKVVERGQHIDPARRYPSMRALLDALLRGRRLQRRKRVAVIASGALAVGLALLAWEAKRRFDIRQECAANASRIDAEWNSKASSTLESAFNATSSPLSNGAWRLTSSGLERYVNEWRDTSTRVCEANLLVGQRSEAAASCLDDRLQLVHSVISGMHHIDAPMLERVPAILQTLTPVALCEDARALAQTPPLPEAARRNEVQRAQAVIADAAVAVNAGRYAAGLVLAQRAVEAARETRYLPVLAQTQLWAGIAHGRLGSFPEARAALEEAASAASASHAEPIAVRAWVQLMHFVGFDGKRLEEGLRYNDYAHAALTTMYAAAELEAERLSWLSALLVEQKQFARAHQASEEQLAVVETRLGTEHHLYAAALDGLAGVLAGQGRNRDALPVQGQACAVLERKLGSPHPQLALCLSNLAAVHANLGAHEESLALKTRALEMFDVLPGHPGHVAMTHRNLARSLLELGRLDEAKRHIELAAALGKSVSDSLAVLRLQGDLARLKGDQPTALTAYRAAVTQSAQLSPASRVEPLLALGSACLTMGLIGEAKQNAGEAGELALAVYGEDSFRLAEPMRLRAEVLLAEKNPTEAVALAQRAVGLLEQAQVDPSLTARAQATLAKTR